MNTERYWKLAIRNIDVVPMLVIFSLSFGSYPGVTSGGPLYQSLRVRYMKKLISNINVINTCPITDVRTGTDIKLPIGLCFVNLLLGPVLPTIFIVNDKL
jgi:hypothetical protein